MAEVMGQAGGVDQVRVTAEGSAEFPADLSALQRVRQPGAREVGLPDGDDLRLRGEPAQCGAVQHASAVALERAAARTLVRLGDEPGGIPAAVPAPAAHLLSLPPVSASATARPASSLATGTRNGEQDT